MGKRIYGKQKPRYKFVPAYAKTDGKDAAELISAYGYELDPWQKDVIKDWLGRDKNDKYTSTTCGLSVPRQNGKNTLLEVRELYGLVINGEKIIHTAHQLDTAREAFIRLSGLFNPEVNPDLAQMVKSIRKGNGMEEIELKNGGRVKFSARSNVSKLGFSVDVVIFDEAQALSDETISVIMPIISASPHNNRQMIYTGTPPTTTMNGEVFGRIRQSAIEQKNNKLAWYEWSIDKLPPKGTDVNTLVELAFDTNPALGRRLTVEFTQQEAMGMSLDGFSIMRLGWWSSISTTTPISKKLWENTLILPKNAPRDGLTTFGVKFSVDGVYVALAGCKTPAGGIPHVELIAYAPILEGMSFLVDFFSDPARIKDVAGIAVDGRSGFGAFVNAIRDKYARRVIMMPSTKGCVDASAMFEQALYDKEITHTDTKDGAQTELNTSALNAIKRPVGTNGGWIYGGESSCPIEAATLALWANKTTTIDPSRKAVIW